MRRALVTGASGAIGSAIARELARAGLHVIAHGHAHRLALDALVAELREAGHSAEAVSFDVTDAADCRAALEPLAADAPIQVIVNNAGHHHDVPMAGMSTAQWRDVVDVNLNGFFNVTQPLLLPMIATRWGRIVSVSSIAGVIGNRGQANYAAAKAGLHGATRSLALEVASRGITANVVAPGVVQTARSADAFPPERVKALVPMQRAGTPEEVAALVEFLASDRAAYITGQVIAISGGLG
jgi:3-oxoacyl-[acyl-carrier protein] reductase